jgi:HEAT repeat protein
LRTVEKATAVAVLTDLAVRSEEPATRGAAVKLLASLEGPEAGQALARLARNASLDPALRREAALWLGSRPGQEGTGALLDLLVAPDTAMRVAAVQALGTSGSDSALARLESLARDDPDPAVRREALRALSRMGTKDAVALLLGQLSTDPARTGPERDALLSAIGDLSSAEAVPSLLGELDTSTDPALRRALVGALARIADPQAFDALRAVAEGERDPAARIQAIQGLGRLGDLRALEVLQARARSADGAERAAAEDAIRQIRKRSR